VEKDKLADLVLLDANPLEDIHNTQKIQAVIVNGKYLDRTSLATLLADAATSASTP
jgi:imidazolonepropionase-like amidohydrolase